jgi:hypothetical protein
MNVQKATCIGSIIFTCFETGASSRFCSVSVKDDDADHLIIIGSSTSSDDSGNRAWATCRASTQCATLSAAAANLSADAYVQAYVTSCNILTGHP